MSVPTPPSPSAVPRSEGHRPRSTVASEAVLVMALVEDRERAMQLLRELDGVGSAAACTVNAADVPIARGAGDEASLLVDQDALTNVLRLAREQYEELGALRSGLERQVVTERAKGVLMARHGIDEEKAFQLLRRHARRTNRKIVDVAGSLLEIQALFAEPGGNGR